MASCGPKDDEPASLNVSKTQLAFLSTGGSFSVDIASNIDWDADSDELWCTVSQKSGSGNATVNISAQANTGATQRTAKITVKMTGGSLSREIAVTQDASLPVGDLVSGTIIGEHANWDQVSVSFDRGTTWAATVPVSGGKFSLTLPVPENKYLENLIVDSDYTVNPQGVKCAFADFYVRKGSQSTKLYVSDDYIEFWYVDKNVSITGSSTLVGYTTVFDMNLKKGWNAASDKREGTKTTKKVVPLPVGVEWEGF